MLRVLLASAPLTIEERYGVFAEAANTQPSFALVCLGAIALQEGADVRLIDASAEGLSVGEVFDEILVYKPDVLGITSTTLGINASGELAKRVKTAMPRVITLIGGCHVTAIPLETMEEFSSFDIGVLGEGERTFAELLSQIREKGGVSPVLEGTVMRVNGEIKMGAPRPLIRNLDELPLPAWHLLRGFPNFFVPSPARIRRSPCASVVFTRGCPNQCSFCDRSVFGRQVRGYSASYALRMVRDLRDNYGVKEILIEDDTFIASHRRVREFCELLIAEKIDITWSCLGRADRADKDLLRLMKLAGCWHIGYGVESGDQRILDAMHKNETIEEIEKAVLISREVGLRTKGFFMVGFPGETRESLRLTRALALRLPLDDISVMQLTPFPGTELYETAHRFGSFERDWRKMNTLNTVFVPHGFTAEELDNARRETYTAFYLRLSVVLKKIADVIRAPRLFRYYFRAFLVLLRLQAK
ncbi:MAG: radical SAM protein [Anaerolineae bacterium]|nr:radical SAM protein [Anaerolineae bacterium]